jgi:hypothetical protein
MQSNIGPLWPNSAVWAAKQQSTRLKKHWLLNASVYALIVLSCVWVGVELGRNGNCWCHSLVRAHKIYQMLKFNVLSVIHSLGRLGTSDWCRSEHFCPRRVVLSLEMGTNGDKLGTQKKSGGQMKLRRLLVHMLSRKSHFLTNLW